MQNTCNGIGEKTRNIQLSVSVNHAVQSYWEFGERLTDGDMTDDDELGIEQQVEIAKFYTFQDINCELVSLIIRVNKLYMYIQEKTETNRFYGDRNCAIF